MYIERSASPVGDILITADDVGLTGLWLSTQKDAPQEYWSAPVTPNVPVLNDAKRWLNIYFSGTEPNFEIPLHFIGSEFQKEVWQILCTIPYGETTTYGAIAQKIAKKRGAAHMSAQAVGGAVGSNKISIIVPCHRVIGADGSLTGYAGGLDKKTALLKLESTKTP